MRIAVRETEAWLLADRTRAAQWLGVPEARIPSDVEALPDPKQALIELARGSRLARIRADVVPRGSARIGPGYVDQVREFCRELWRPETAARSSPSLLRCLRHVRARS